LIAAITRSRAGAVLIAAILPVAVRLMVLPWLPVPPPSIHDEFSYLLAADTFAHGRLSNPTHPMWKFFESFHILQQPNYISMYPPMQGLLLAFGQVFLGHPFWAVCLSMAVMCGLMCWTMQGWVPPRWALAGTLLFSVKFVPAWTNSYWGGAVAGIGGCLLTGPLIRTWRARKPRRLTLYGVLMGLGAAILMHSRPWEGLLVAIPATAVLGVWMFRSSVGTIRSRLFGLVGPYLLIVCMGVAAMGYYNWRTTGSATTMPYQIHSATYRMALPFLWQPIRQQIKYRHEVMRRFHAGWELVFHGANQQHTMKGWLLSRRRFGYALILCALLVCVRFIRIGKIQVLTILLTSSLVGMGLQRYLLLHYFAPIVPVVFAAYMFGLRSLWHLGRPSFRWGRPVIAIVFCGVAAFFAFSAVERLDFEIYHAVGWKRSALERQLAAGKHLVLVRYAPHHWEHEEWVYNGADIDSAAVVWARDMGAEANREIRAYYAKRQIWCLEPDRRPIRPERCQESDRFIGPGDSFK